MPLLLLLSAFTGAEVELDEESVVELSFVVVDAADTDAFTACC